MKHILRSLPLGKPFCPTMSGITLIKTFTRCSVYYTSDTHTRAPCCTLVRRARPFPDASQPAAWPTITRRPRPPPPCPGPSLAPSVPPLFSHIHHARDRESEGRAGGEEDHSWRGRRRHPLHHHMRSLGEARLGRVGGINAKTRKPTPSLPPWFHLPPRLVSPPSPLHLIYLHRAMHARHVLWKRLACMRMDTQHGSLWMLLLGASPRK